MPDRTRPPRIHTLQSLQLPVVDHAVLANGLDLYSVDLGTQEVMRLEVVFRAGRPYERRPLAARGAAALLKEGSKGYDSNSLNEHFDFYGANLSMPYSMDAITVGLYSLNRHLDKVLPVFIEMLQEPSYDERELQAFIRRNVHALREDLTKNDVVAYREITQTFFGDHHPYGYNSWPETYQSIERQDLVDHHARLMHAGNAFAVLSGRLTKQVRTTIRQYLEQLPVGERAEPWNLAVEPMPPVRRRLERPDTLQTAIRMGQRQFARNHPDYAGMYVLNTILGGYFGSRLMENIREEKGYTYNIYSSLDAMRYDGSFHISAEVSNDHVADTLHEIYREVDLLRDKLVGKEELEMVRNYLMGTFLTQLDGPFSAAEVVRSLLAEGVPLQAFGQLVEKVTHITAREVRELARQYLDREHFSEVIVGP